MELGYYDDAAVRVLAGLNTAAEQTAARSSQDAATIAELRIAINAAYAALCDAPDCAPGVKAAKGILRAAGAATRGLSA